MSLDYPIKFKPILQERIWGGNKLHQLFGKAKRKEPIGESWEVSAIPNNVSVVANGCLKGKDLQYLIDNYKADFVGEKVFKRFGTKFPLLLKFMDAKSDLSIQLHPNDTIAQKRHNSFGKEEMWYIMQAEKDSNLLFGFNQKLTKEIYLKHLNNNTLPNIVHRESICEGDVYHIPSGRVHAIGSGVVLAEIQQSSDITYRLYDWNRKDSQGKARELHTALALDAIDFAIPNSFKTTYTTTSNCPSSLLKSPKFKTNLLDLDRKMKINETAKDSFTIYMCVKGAGIFKTRNHITKIATGETVFIPATLNNYAIVPETDSMRLLQVKV